MKRVLFLGGAAAQVPAIEYARMAGHFVITADYLPDNPGHRIAHEYHNCSTTDREGILSLAASLALDGIVAYASDPAAPTAAFVAEKLGLASNPFKTVEMLTSKHLYRRFLKENGFSCPSFDSYESWEKMQVDQERFNLPVVVKPVDSSGSKGVCVVRDWPALERAFEEALVFSRVKRVIIEEFVGEDGVQILGEGFVWKGRLILSCFARHRFNVSINGLVPIGGDFPFGNVELKKRLREELQKLIDLCGLKMGPMNLEFRIGSSGEVYLMEVAPRNGGNMIPQLITRATGFDMVKNTVDVAVGLNCAMPEKSEIKGFYSYCVLHSSRDGQLRRISFSEALEKCICESNIWSQPGDHVSRFTGANRSLGVLICSFSSEEEQMNITNNISDHVRVEVE